MGYTLWRFSLPTTGAKSEGERLFNNRGLGGRVFILPIRRTRCGALLRGSGESLGDCVADEIRAALGEAGEQDDALVEATTD